MKVDCVFCGKKCDVDRDALDAASALGRPVRTVCKRCNKLLKEMYAHPRSQEELDKLVATIMLLNLADFSYVMRKIMEVMGPMMGGKLPGGEDEGLIYQ